MMRYTGHSPLCRQLSPTHLRKGISGSLRTASINAAHREGMCWPCFSPLAHEWVSPSPFSSSLHGESHPSSKIEAEDFKFLRADFDHLFYPRRPFSPAGIPF